MVWVHLLRSYRYARFFPVAHFAFIVLHNTQHHASIINAMCAYVYMGAVTVFIFLFCSPLACVLHMIYICSRRCWCYFVRETHAPHTNIHFHLFAYFLFSFFCHRIDEDGVFKSVRVRVCVPFHLSLEWQWWWWRIYVYLDGGVAILVLLLSLLLLLLFFRDNALRIFPLLFGRICAKMFVFSLSQSFQFVRVIYWYRFHCRHINFQKKNKRKQKKIILYVDIIATRMETICV